MVLRPSDPVFDNLLIEEYFERYSLAKYTGQPLKKDQWLERRHENVAAAQHVVTLRKRPSSLCRLESVRPGAGSVFYLRLLLQHYPSRDWSFDIDGMRYDDYYEAAGAAALCIDGNEASLAMLEAIGNWKTPAQLRFLFIQLISEGANAVSLWEEHYLDLSLDFFRMLGDQALASSRTIQSFAKLLAERNRTTADYGLPQPEDFSFETQREIEYFAARCTSLREQARDQRSSFNAGQRTIYTDLLEYLLSLTDDRPRLIIALAGRGKTYLLQVLAALFRSHGQVVLLTASSALAASIYERGRTYHSLFHIPVEENHEDLQSKMPLDGSRADLIRSAAVIVLDEIYFGNKADLECIDRLLRAITREPRKPFGGKKIIMAGDQLQCGPVVKHGGPSAVYDASLQSSYLRHLCKVHTLTEPIRNAQDPDFAEFLDSVGRDLSGDRVDLSEYLRTTSDLEAALEELYPDEVLADPIKCSKRAWLSPVNLLVDEVNGKVMDKLAGDYRNFLSLLRCSDADNAARAVDHFYSRSHVVDFDESLDKEPPGEYIDVLTHHGVPPHKLSLKDNAVCSIMRNISLDKGLVKNARVIVLNTNKYYIEVQPVNSRRSYLLTRINFTFKPTNFSFSINRNQFPLRPAYATTFNSCQGLTLDNFVVFDFRVDPFAHGQLYAALTRIKDRNAGLVLLPDDTMDVANVVNGLLID